MTFHYPVPSPLGGIRNGAHLAPFALWRGEQPPADEDTARSLRSVGIDVIVSLRADGEPANRQLPEYSVSDERSRWTGRGFGFQHVPMTDFAAPHPAELADALQTLDREIDAGRTVYVHCRVGVGRTGIVSGAWLVSRGVSGDAAAEVYLNFWDEIFERSRSAAQQTPAARAEFMERVGIPHQWWAVLQISEALGSPIGREFDVPPARRPADSDSWEEQYRILLRPWRRPSRGAGAGG